MLGHTSPFAPVQKCTPAPPRRLAVKELDRALARWDPRGDPMMVLMLLNRSPCSRCAHQLAGALHHFNDRYALTTEKQHFVVASLGYYHSNKDAPKPPGGWSPNFTTGKGLREMKEAGWKHGVLSFDRRLTRRGRQLSDFLSTMG